MSARRPRSARAHRDCRQDDPCRLARTHARHRGPDGRRDAWLRLVVSRLQHQGDLLAGFRVLRRIELIVWSIPHLGSMIYSRNGMTMQLNLRAEGPGTVRGLSSHYSGDGFSDMHFDVHAVSPEQFAAWIERTRSTGPALDPASYAELARQSMNISPFTFRAADPALFQQIVTQQLPPGPGPRTGRPHPSVSPR